MSLEFYLKNYQFGSSFFWLTLYYQYWYNYTHRLKMWTLHRSCIYMYNKCKLVESMSSTFSCPPLFGKMSYLEVLFKRWIPAWGCLLTFWGTFGLNCLKGAEENYRNMAHFTKKKWVAWYLLSPMDWLHKLDICCTRIYGMALRPDFLGGEYIIWIRTLKIWRNAVMYIYLIGKIKKKFVYIFL